MACVASVSVRSRSKERGTRVKDRAKNDVSKRAGRVFFGSCFISRAAKTENPVPRSFFALLRGKEIVGAAILSICAASPSDPVALWDRMLCNNLSDSEFSLWQICYSTVR